MKSILLMVVCFVAFGLILQAEDIPPAIKTDFLGKVKAAVAQKDFAAFSALYCQKGTVDPAMKDQLDKFTKGLFDTICSMEAPDFEFAAPPLTLQTSFSHQGKNYETNVEVVTLLQIHDPNGKPGTTAGGIWCLPLGVDNGALRIAQTVLKN